MAVVRRSLGYRRYVFSVQYHGSSFLGFSWQGNQENAILPDGTDLRGYRSVEGRLRQALQDFFPTSSSSGNGFENIQVSSRTDRGVHALKNTCHVDLWNKDNKLNTSQIHRGLNFFLSRQRELHSGASDNDSTDPSASPKAQRRLRGASQVVLGGKWVRHDPMNEMRVLAVKEAPAQMPNPAGHEREQPAIVDWNARFSATQRTYMYRILHTHNPVTLNDDDDNNDNHHHIHPLSDWAAPFEWDRSWRVQDHHAPLNVTAMRAAAAHLQGTHDFSAFRATGCQRSSPITTLHNIEIHSQSYGPPLSWEKNVATITHGMGNGGALGLGSCGTDDSPCQLVTILFTGNSFLYRQVRNMVSCLVAVGRGRLEPDAVAAILMSRARSRETGVAPAHGLYLVDVQHGDFSI